MASTLLPHAAPGGDSSLFMVTAVAIGLIRSLDDPFVQWLVQGPALLGDCTVQSHRAVVE